MNQQYVIIADVEATAESEKAILVSVEGDEVWVPKKIIHDDSETYKKGTSGNLIVQKWWADKNKLEGEDYGL